MSKIPSARSACLLALLLATACSRGPDADAIQQDLQGKLDTQFKPGLFEVSEFSRNGHYGFTNDDGEPRLLIYTRVRLKLKEDYTFADWDQLNLSALTSLLGATPEGIKGVTSEGNKAGDELRVMGTVTYAEEGEGWALAGLSPQGGATARAAGMDQLSEFEKDLAGLSERFKSLENKKKTAHVAVIEEELALALRDIGLRLDGLDEVPTLLSGAKGGEYHALGSALAAVSKEAKTALGHYGSEGSIDNCRLVASRRAEFAIVQNDIAALAYGGKAMFTGTPAEELRAVCSLYPEAIQVVTTRASGITSVAGLAGKRVDLGPRGSGSRLNALDLLAAYGLSVNDLAAAGERSLAEAVAALKAGEVDAIFTTHAAPARPIEALALEVELLVLPLAGPEAEALRATRPDLAQITLPAHAYRGQDAAVSTLGVTAMILTRADVPAAHVDALLGLLFDHSEGLTSRAPLAGSIGRGSARNGLSIPMHPAAEAKFPKE